VSALTNLPPFDYERISDLVGALESLGSGAVPIYGGTELLPAMGMGLLAPEKVVSLKAVEELRVCHVEHGCLVVGAGLTHLEISRHELVRSLVPLLGEVADGVGNIRVRSTGTLGGNLAFAEPRSDLTTTLLAFDARIRLAGAAGVRSLPLSEFVLGPYEVDLRPGELIISVAIREGASDFSIYRKVVMSERPVVGAALVHLVGPSRWRLVVGAVGLSPTILDTERLVEIDAVALASNIDVTSDLSGSEDYKRHLTFVTVRRCIAAAEESKEKGAP